MLSLENSNGRKKLMGSKGKRGRERERERILGYQSVQIVFNCECAVQNVSLLDYTKLYQGHTKCQNKTPSCVRYYILWIFSPIWHLGSHVYNPWSLPSNSNPSLSLVVLISFFNVIALFDTHFIAMKWKSRGFGFLLVFIYLFFSAHCRGDLIEIINISIIHFLSKNHKYNTHTHTRYYIIQLWSAIHQSFSKKWLIYIV